MLTRKMFLLKNKKLKKGEHSGQHSADVAVLVWQDRKQVTMVSTYHKSEMPVTRNKANQEETKPLIVCDYNIKTC
jgi:hypothetical protein